MNNQLTELIDVKVRQCWTPEQAWAIYELLTNMTEIIRQSYEAEISALFAHNVPNAQSSQPPSVDLDDNFPF